MPENFGDGGHYEDVSRRFPLIVFTILVVPAILPAAGMPAYRTPSDQLGNWLKIAGLLPAPILPRVVPLKIEPPPPSGVKPLPLADLTSSLARVLGLRMTRIVIDAGHGGFDYGSIGANGLREKDAVLDVALRTAALLRKGLGTEVILVRDDDTFVPLQRRAAIANERHADLFLSIHANSSPRSSASGPETYLLNFTPNPVALEVAARENSGSDRPLSSLRDLVQAIAMNDKVAESKTLAESVQTALLDGTTVSKLRERDRGVKKAPFVVLVGASMPSVLAEIGFLSNAREEENLARPGFRQRIAEALCEGVRRYAESLNRPELLSRAGKARARYANAHD